MEENSTNIDFISQNINLLSNDSSTSNSILKNLKNLLLNCTNFDFAVAFLTRGGLILIKNTLKELEKRKVKGRVIVGDYLCFTEPLAIKELLKFKNIEVFFAPSKFHIKGYIFKLKNGNYSTFIGSANLTQSALKTNLEWCILTQNQPVKNISTILKGFENLLKNSIPLTKEQLEKYTLFYEKNRLNKKIVPDFTSFITPNKMQKLALNNLTKLREKGVKKAVLISATGTGKTYLSAFDVQKTNARRLLFIAHREEILQQALETFKSLFNNVTFGFLNGIKKDIHKDFIFATINMIAKNKILANLKEDYFD